jgi:murein DD-endopeptidase MepM/ murein hydrolase activator NlpD
MERRSISVCLAALTLGACVREKPVTLPQSRDVVLPAETQIIEAIVPRRATLDSLLRQHQMSAQLIQSVIESAATVFNLRQLRAERPYRLVLSLDGLLREFEYQIDADRFLRIVSLDRSRPETLLAQVLPYEKEKSIVAIRGSIDADHPSLIAAMDETGENIQLALALADVFSGQIDFQSDLQPGDTFEVLFEKSTRDGEFAGYGAIVAARFVADRREHQAFRWTNPETAKSGYYDADGRSLKRFMLRSPLKFEPRITSRFSQRRLHPVYRTYRAHLGVDYGAPQGASVVAVSSGTVVSAGWAGGGGNQIRLRHAGGYESYYLHLSSFASGIRPGAHVDQGQLIGRVGATGTATGPHLDYRLRKNGRFVNPLVEHSRMPPGEPIPKVLLDTFFVSRDTLRDRLSNTLLAGATQKKPDAVRAIH